MSIPNQCWNEEGTTDEVCCLPKCSSSSKMSVYQNRFCCCRSKLALSASWVWGFLGFSHFLCMLCLKGDLWCGYVHSGYEPFSPPIESKGFMSKLDSTFSFPEWVGIVFPWIFHCLSATRTCCRADKQGTTLSCCVNEVWIWMCAFQQWLCNPSVKCQEDHPPKCWNMLSVQWECSLSSRGQYLFKNKPPDGSAPPNSFYRALYPKIIQDIEVRNSFQVLFFVCLFVLFYIFYTLPDFLMVLKFWAYFMLMK